MTTPTETTTRQRRSILFLLAIAVLVVVMDLTILNVALQPIQRELKASQAALQWCVDSYMITFAAFIFTGGVCADRFGRKRTLMAALVIFGVASLLAALSGSIGQLVLCRAFMGVGAAAVPTVTLAIILNVFPPAERAKAIAVWAGAAGAAFAVGPVVAGALLANFWWGSVFLVNVPLVVIGVVLIQLWIPESKNPNNTHFDPAGLVLSILAIAALVYGIVTGGENDDWTAPKTVAGLVVGVVLLLVLVPIERRVPAPALDMSLFSKSRFTAGTAAIALSFFGLMGAIFILTFYFQSIRDYSAFEAGLLMLPMGIGSMAMSSRCPKLVPLVGGRTVVAAGAIAMAVTFGLYALCGAGTSVAVIVVLQLLFGLGWGCIMAPATGALMSVVPLPKAGAGQAVSQTLRQVGAALGVAVIGSVLSVAYRSSLGSAVNILPADLRTAARGSVGATQQAIATAAGRGLNASALRSRSVDAYLHGMHISMVIAAVVALAVALISLRWLPGRPPSPAAGAEQAPAATTAPAGR
ncbi:MFS transporter [Jatrophihabitans lederbergiae]|uniref:MFS transporter n=1 Tax=Jatrophihabitans lederbergiae TaxID=3075547 RepID=A0ABU2JGE8_9ACTN|nr:MFS transporter [Jatrophihabitans sp. DSM 44399]MDT0263826.1 MFS transporter [Jatrophihabitans sp. DSM 44399]